MKCFFVASRHCLKQFHGKIFKSFGSACNFISLTWFLGPEVFSMSSILITHKFSYRSRSLMSNTDNISPNLWPNSNTNNVASLWLRYFKLLVSVLDMYVIRIPTSHANLYFVKAGLILKTTLINLVMTGCWPDGTPSILINVDNESCIVHYTIPNSTLK